MSIILSIESSCDDTSAAVLRDDRILSNVIASQKVHEMYGGVVPELASRAHQQNIVPVVDAAIAKAGISKEEIDAIAFTRGPGLLGSLMVGVSFAKGLSLSLNKPLVEVNHLQAHVLSHFIKKDDSSVVPQFPFICLLVSGGHTQILLLKSHFDIEVLGSTIDDAAGEAIDKAAKIMDLGYPGGPIIDRLAKEGNPDAYHFATPNIPNYDYSFSGIKTSFLYFVRDELAKDPNFIENHKADLCASIQKTIVDFLLKKLEKAVCHTNVRQIAIAGGVSANSRLREGITQLGAKHHWDVFIPEFQFCTDNAAMVGIAGYFKYLHNDFADISLPPYARG
ncbi:MAG: tRNA (adenosine(37)-N6)-threonylcarbamoyltransferase complex transferase subunit TsaD [Bacteroidales bacterium]|nr:tRNA (adenosine(37)-N6)-threonylcarbamoyltransferase complex transferase subunit TsaD [Bacteroidales bacterium]